MSVRSRLAVILAVVLLPLLVGAGLVVAIVVPDRLEEEAHARLRIASGAVAALQVETCLGVGDSARVMALAVSRGEPAAMALANGLDRRSGYGLILRGDTVVARSRDVPPGLPLDAHAAAACSSATSRTVPPAPAGGATVPSVRDSIDILTGGQRVTAVVATPLDRNRLADWWSEIGSSQDLELAVACPDGSTASTRTGQRGDRLAAAAKAKLTGTRQPVISGEVEQTGPGAGHPCLVVAASQVQGKVAGPWWTWFTLAFAALFGAGLVWWLSGQLTRPILAITDAAERAAQGDLRVRLPVDRRDEVGRLAESFNHMAGQLDQRLTEVQHSRDLLSENVRQLGDALQRTHDIDGLLATVSAISAATTGSARATTWLIEGHSLVSRVAWPADSTRSRVGRVPRDGTLPGLVVTDGVPRWLLRGDESAVLGGPTLATALQRGDTMLGAVVVEREAGATPYTEEDAATLTSITGPAGVAMDNALLHREAQRSSVTDPLTGVGNLRMLTTVLAGEVERARHFDRSVSLLILDLDHFRELNDTHGHAAGDAVLASVAVRIAASVRRVDRVARYGGEEFAVVLPELDHAQARSLAERVWSAIRSEPFDVEGVAISVRVSVGVASWPEQARTSTELLRAADAAVAKAKRSGRDQVVTSGSVAG